MRRVVNIQNKGRGAPPFPVYKWKVNLHGETPYYCDTLKEAKNWAEQNGGVTEWVRTVDYRNITYTPRLPETK